MKTIYGIPRVIMALEEQLMVDSVNGVLSPRLPRLETMPIKKLFGMNFINLPEMNRQIKVPKRQDRRKNKRIQARRRMREARAGVEPDDSIYLVDMDKAKRGLERSLERQFYHGPEAMPIVVPRMHGLSFAMEQCRKNMSIINSWS